jgi:ABC-type sugar transport system ATPase subunit
MSFQASSAAGPVATGGGGSAAGSERDGRKRRVILLAEAVHKRYGGIHALRGAGLEVGAGEVLALVGENGSGKSTLLGIISGQRWPDSGVIELDGERVSFPDPTAAIAAGIAVVTQETTLVPELPVAENIFLGRRMARGRLGIDWRRTRQDAEEVLDRLGLTIDPAIPVGELRPDQQQLVEIGRAISMNARVLILDEPTSSLTDDEVDHLFRIIRRLKETGVGTIFVSHRLSEVEEIGDRVTVLRDGHTVGSGPIGDYDRGRMIHEMIGRRPEPFVGRKEEHKLAEPVLRVRGLSVAGRVRDVDLEVGAGEIVGLAGLVGAGRTDVFEALFGLHAETEGTIEVDGRPFVATRPGEAMRHGLAFVPGDRKRLGLVSHMTVRENLMLAATTHRFRLASPRRSNELLAVDRAVRSLDIRAPSPHASVSTLSGGNQQKVVLGKWLETDPRALLLDEPTRGVDVGAKAEIYGLLDRAKERGLAILVSSSEVPELLLLCDRIVVMFRGRVVARLSRDEANETRITQFATGHEA